VKDPVRFLSAEAIDNNKKFCYSIQVFLSRGKTGSEPFQRITATQVCSIESPMSRSITLRQTQILQFIKNFILDQGYAPTRREIMRHFDLKSTRGVAEHLIALKKKGYLTQTGKLARALEVRDLSVLYRFPVVGKVLPGRPILAEENLEGRLALDFRAAPWGDAFFVRVKEEGLERAGIFNGDYVLVLPQPSAKEGALVAVALESNLLIRYFSRKKEVILLYKEKTDPAPIEIPRASDTFRFLGKVVSVVRFTEGPLTW
jgi:repressor LexA